MQRVSVSLEDSTADAVLAWAMDERRSLSGLIARIVEEALAERGERPLVSLPTRNEPEAGIEDRVSTPVPRSASVSKVGPGENPTAEVRVTGASTSHFSTAEVEDELPWLPALGRRATQKDFEDPNFDPEEYR